MSAPARIGDDLLMFTLRLIQHCADEATAAYWERRAEDFERAVSRPGDFAGRRSAADRQAADDRNRLTALACRRHAALLRERWTQGQISPELTAVLEDVLGEVR